MTNEESTEDEVAQEISSNPGVDVVESLKNRTLWNHLMNEDSVSIHFMTILRSIDI